jgi:hypothetical protein
MKRVHSEKKPHRTGLLRKWFPKRHRSVRVLLIFIVFLVVVRLLLPSITLYIVNDRLAHVKGYFGHVEDVDLSLFLGSYTLNHIYLNQMDSATKKQTPFLSARRVDLSMDFSKLFSEGIVGSVVGDCLSVQFTHNKMEPGQIAKDQNVLKDLGEVFMPFFLNTIKVTNGTLRYIDQASDPFLDLRLDNVHLEAENLRTKKDAALLPSYAWATAEAYGGKMRAGARMNLLADQPTFDIDAELKNVNLVALNDFFRAYAKMDVNQGKFDAYFEAAAHNGATKGYIKPVIRNLDVLGHEDRKDNLFQKIYEGLIGTAAAIVTNPKTHQFAAKIPFAGTSKETDVDLWKGVFTAFRNAFIQMIQASLDNSININSPTKNVEKKVDLRKIFHKKGKAPNSKPKAKKAQ